MRTHGWRRDIFANPRWYLQGRLHSSSVAVAQDSDASAKNDFAAAGPFFESWTRLLFGAKFTVGCCTTSRTLAGKTL
ncbi:MAG: hypothetical protein D6679_11385 [Candidatus Hydrogenedentota bacterium]|nr:MAG: hypothetical protein D6679_11385 [Candidatus Hydrogenedentota bacterium]